MPPHRLAGGHAVARDDLVFAALLLGVDQIAANRERRPARPHRTPPELDRGTRLPIRLDAHAADDTVATRTTEARPLGLDPLRHLEVQVGDGGDATEGLLQPMLEGVSGSLRVRHVGSQTLSPRVSEPQNDKCWTNPGKEMPDTSIKVWVRFGM